MAGGATARVHPSKRHNHPLQYKSGKPRLRPLNITQYSKEFIPWQAEQQQKYIQVNVKVTQC